MIAVAALDRPVLSLADLEAFDPHAPAGHGERRFLCPLPACRGKPRDAAHRSLSLTVPTGVWTCHRCDARGTLREAWRPRAEVRRAAALRAFGLTPAAPAKPPAAAAAPPQQQHTWDWRANLARSLPVAGTPGERYLAGRGVPVALATAAGVRFSPLWCGRPAVLFPMRDRAGALVAANGRYIDGLDKRAENPLSKTRTGGTRKFGVFALPGVLAAEPLVVAEGPMDVLSLAVCGVPAVAPVGTNVPDWLPVVGAFRRVVFALDADQEGDKRSAEHAPRFASLGARVERWRPDGAAAVKDWNEWLLADPARLRAWALHQLSRHAPAAAAPPEPVPAAAGPVTLREAYVAAWEAEQRRHQVEAEIEASRASGAAGLLELERRLPAVQAEARRAFQCYWTIRGLALGFDADEETDLRARLEAYLCQFPDQAELWSEPQGTAPAETAAGAAA